ncbi:MAG TPA: VOC family protein [Candidatus Acidoferrales bacterium]
MIHVKRITPVLYVEEIEPCLKFWTERMGFSNAAQVPDGNKIGFLMLQKDGTEIMYQTFASQEKDDPAISQIARKGPTFLFIEVEKLDPLIAAMKGVELVLPERKTFYGSREIGVKDAAGHYIIFAEFLPKPRS